MSHLVIKEFTHGKGKVAKVGDQVEMVKASGLTVNRLISTGHIAPDPETAVVARQGRANAEDAKKNFEEAKAKKEAKSNGKVESKSDDSEKKKKSGKKKTDE